MLKILCMELRIFGFCIIPHGPVMIYQLFGAIRTGIIMGDLASVLYKDQ